VKAKDVREMTSTELVSQHRELSEELMNLRFQLSMKELNNPARIKQVRKDIARINTIMHERELGING